jgi:two-component system cell cycle sensor histidine kinase/response regulator CckA
MRRHFRTFFEPFFTTKEAGKGTGLGLSTAHGIVEQSRGRLTVESRPAKGTVFRAYFPVTNREDAEEIVDQRPAQHRHGTGTVLVAEDDGALRKLICKTLADAGYRVLQASNGQEALRLEGQEPTVDLLLTDVVMPGMSGPELMDRVRSRRPDLIVLFLSGYDRALIGERTLDPAVAFLPKPFTLKALLNRVHELIVQDMPERTGPRHDSVGT